MPLPPPDRPDVNATASPWSWPAEAGPSFDVPGLSNSRSHGPSPVFDQLGAMHVLANGVDFSDNGQAMEAFHQVEPGGHFLGCAHTQANFETAFYRSNIADNNSVEQWREEGSKDAATRANALWKSMLAEYEGPPLDQGKDEAIREFIDKRKASMPDANY